MEARTRRKPFPPTRQSVLRDLSAADGARREQAFEILVDAYWRPVYTYLRLFKRVGREEAEDLTQGFFAHALEKRTLERYDPSRARFRTWIRTCLDGYVANAIQASKRVKRGGAIVHVSLDFETAEGEVRQRELPVEEDVEAFFHREWTRRLLTTAVEDLTTEARNAGRELELEIFERYDLEAPDAEPRLTYADLARELGVTPVKVTNALHAMRRRLRELVLARLRAVCGSDAEARAEALALFGSFGGSAR